MRLASHLPRLLASVGTAVAAGIAASALVPVLVFGGTSEDLVSAAAPLAGPALIAAFGVAPFLGCKLQAEGASRFVWLSVLTAFLFVVSRDMSWIYISGLEPSSALVWAAVFKAFLMGVPSGLAAASACLLVLRFVPRPGTTQP